MTYVNNSIIYAFLACLVALALHLPSYYIFDYPWFNGPAELITRGVTIGVIWGIIKTRRDSKKKAYNKG